MMRRYCLEDITPWDNNDNHNLLSFFQEGPERKPPLLARRISHHPLVPNNTPLPDHPIPQPRRRTSSHCHNIRTLHHEARKSMREINIQFHPHNQSTLNNHSFLTAHPLPLQEVTVRNTGEGVGSRKKKRESTYILKQKFATIRRSSILMGENKENALKAMRYEH